MAADFYIGGVYDSYMVYLSKPNDCAMCQCAHDCAQDSQSRNLIRRRVRKKRCYLLEYSRASVYFVFYSVTRNLKCRVTLLLSTVLPDT